MKLIENRHNIADTLNGQKLTFALKTDNSWKVFGGIWEKDIIAEIKKKFKLELSRSHIDMPDWHLKKVWEHIVYVKLGKDSMAKMFVVVNAEK
jgi:ribosomal protein L9